jgi:photosystem II stability/assembly factor-like uncharacterized protein
MSHLMRLLCSTAVAIPFLSVAFVAAPAGTLPAAAATVAGATRPKDFAAQSITWVSPTRGWMLGSAPCGARSCRDVVATTNGGRTWVLRGKVRAPLSPYGHRGVTELRFANRQIGWAYGPALHATTDGGASWLPEAIPGGGRRVLAMTAGTDAAYLVESACKPNRPLNHCHHPSILWTSQPPGAGWTKVSVNLPVSNQGLLASVGWVAYVAIPRLYPDRDVLYATVDGTTWERRTVPCSKPRDETLTSVAPMAKRRVALLCIGDPGIGKSVKRVFRSNDAARTLRSAGTAPLLGITSQLAATPDGTLALASFSSGSWIYRNVEGRTWTTAADLGDGGEGWNDIGFTTDTTGFVIHGPEAFFGPGELWGTTDAGATWGPLPQSPVAQPR